MKYESFFTKFSFSFNDTKYPLYCYLKVTTNCMLNCKFCSQAGDSQVDIDFNFAKKFLKNVKEFGIEKIYITGGEPLLYPKIVDLLEYGHILGLKQILVTNGLLLLNNNNAKLLDYIDSLGISLYGREDTHDKIVGAQGVRRKIIDNVNFVHNSYKNIKININYTVTKENNNIEDLVDIYNFSKEINSKISFARVNYVGNGCFIDNKDDINEILKNISKLSEINSHISNSIVPCAVDNKYRHFCHGCGAGLSFISVEPNGDVKICPTSKVIIGNLYNKSLKNIWGSRVLTEYRKLKWLPNICRNCQLLINCKGGCHSEGSKFFWKDSCDDLFLHRYEKIWNFISERVLTLKFPRIIKIGFKQYILIGDVIRKIDKEVFSVFKYLDGNLTGNQIFNLYKNKKCIKDLLVELEIDGMLIKNA